MSKKYHVRLSESERKYLQEEQSEKATPKSIRKRCNVLLLADENAGTVATQEEISIRCGVSDVTVYNVIKDCATQGVEYCMRRRVHEVPPNPPIVTGEKEARIVALACGSAPKGHSRWTVRLLAEKIVELEIMDRVSYETVRTVLKKHSLDLTKTNNGAYQHGTAQNL